MTERENNSVLELWQSQPVEGVKMSVEEIRKRANKFENKIVRRNRREIVSCFIVSALFLYFLVDTPYLVFRISYGMFILAMIWIAIQIRRKGAVNSLPVELGASSSLQFFRAELERHRDVLKNVWPWYLAPMLPGYIMMSIGYAITFPQRVRWFGVIAFDVFSILLFIGIWKMNARAARCVQRSIDELDAAEKNA